MDISRKLLAMFALALASGFAHAGGVNWSIGINLPPVATVISNGPVYVDGPYYAAAPSPYYAAAPYYAPPPVYRPAPIYYAPPPVVVYRQQPRYAGPPVRFVEERWVPHRHRHWEHRGHYKDRPGRGGHRRDD